jgi:hypothetical protein
MADDAECYDYLLMLNSMHVWLATLRRLRKKPDSERHT